MTLNSPCIIGIDPSLTRTGIAIIDGDTITVTHITSKGRAGATPTESAERLGRLCAELDHLLDGLGTITLVAIELPAMSQHNAGTSLVNGLWWSFVRELSTRGLPVAAITPTSLKTYATGKGNAGKDEVLLSVARRFPSVSIETNDQADAVVLAAMGWHWAMGQSWVEMPMSHTRALAKVAWPSEVARDDPVPVPATLTAHAPDSTPCCHVCGPELCDESRHPQGA